MTSRFLPVMLLGFSLAACGGSGGDNPPENEPGTPGTSAAEQACAAGGGSWDGAACTCADTTLAWCGEACVDLQSDADACGACDNACDADEWCADGVCMAAPDDYPPGPYGVDKGDTIAPLVFGNAEGGSFFLEAVHTNPNRRVLLLSSIAGWSSASSAQLPGLAALHSDYAGTGLLVVTALFENADGDPATIADVQAWRDAHNPRYQVVLDETHALGAYYDEAQTPMNMLIDVDTMQILTVMTGFDAVTLRAQIEANL